MQLRCGTMHDRRSYSLIAWHRRCTADAIGAGSAGEAGHGRRSGPSGAARTRVRGPAIEDAAAARGAAGRRGRTRRRRHASGGLATTPGCGTGDVAGHVWKRARETAKATSPGRGSASYPVTPCSAGLSPLRERSAPALPGVAGSRLAADGSRLRSPPCTGARPGRLGSEAPRASTTRAHRNGWPCNAGRPRVAGALEVQDAALRLRVVSRTANVSGARTVPTRPPG